MDVREVEQQQRVRAVEDLAEERRLVHLGVRPVEQRRDVLDGEWDVEHRLRRANVGHEHVELFARSRHGQQVSRLEPPAADERDVLAHERRVRRGAPTSRDVSRGRGRAARALPSDNEMPCGIDAQAALAQRVDRARERVRRADVLRDDFDEAEILASLDEMRDLRTPANAEPERRDRASVMIRTLRIHRRRTHRRNRHRRRCCTSCRRTTS